MTASTCVRELSDFIYISNGYLYHPPFKRDFILLVIRPHITCYCESFRELKMTNWVQRENEFNSKALSAIFNLDDKILTLGNCNRSLRYFSYPVRS